MPTNTTSVNSLIGFNARGPSNSIASPGVAHLFGGGSNIPSKPQPAMASSQGGAGGQPAQFRPQTQDRTMNRYTPTYSSNAFAHSQYETPLRNNESAASRTLATTGTSIEDYGRRNQQIDKNIFAQATNISAGRPATANIVQREIVHVDDGDCANCVNHEMQSYQKKSHLLEKLSNMTIEQRRNADLKAQEERELALSRAQRMQNQHEMKNTLSQIESQKRAQWDAKKNDRSNLEQTQKLNNEIQQLSMQGMQDKTRSQQNYKDDINRMRENAIQLNVNGKINDRELERRLKGLTFECYDRDQRIKEEAKNTNGFLKSQISQEKQRKQQEKEQMTQPPEVFFTDKELNDLRVEAEARNQELKAHNTSNARDQLNQHLHKQQNEFESKQRNIADEREQHNQMRLKEQQEDEYKRMNKEGMRYEMNNTLSALERQKRREWDAKKSDQTNRIQTEQLNNEISALTQQSIEDQHRSKQSYKNDLSSMTNIQKAQLEQEKREAKESELRSKGFKFECYRRDPMMKEAARETGGFQKSQNHLEKLKKQQEREHMVQAPESMITSEHMQTLQNQALYQDMEKKNTLNSIMRSQYQETQAQKQGRLAAEKAEDAAQAARASIRNSEINRIERDVAETTKRGYNQVLSSQISNAQKMRQLDQDQRKYDSNTQRIIEENQRIGERIVKCGKCKGTLAHERTVLNGSGHHH